MARKMSKNDFENYMRFRQAARENFDEIREILNKNGFQISHSYEPEVVAEADGKLRLITHFVVTQEFNVE